MKAEKVILMAAALIIMICVVGFFVASRRESELKSQINKLERNEDKAKEEAEIALKEAMNAHLQSGIWKTKYDSSLASEMKARKESDSWKHKYESLKSIHYHFTSDAQRDSVLSRLYPDFKPNH